MRCGLLGRKLGHSYSPRIHGYLGGYSYELFPREPEELDAFFADPASFDAINVTIPYKQTVMAYCHHISPEAAAIGAVNTIVRRDGELWGYNTDYYGFDALLSGVCDVSGKKVLVLGSGGASKTVCAVIAARGGRAVVISRTGEENYDNIHRHYADADVIVNTTPVGMYPHCPASPVSLKPFAKLSAAVDIIYNPARTGILLEAERLGIPCANGLYMLVAQAKAASELFCDTKLPDDLNETITARIAGEMENIVFVGMPGCGKSTVAHILSRRLDRPLYDSDEAVRNRTGRTPADIIRQDGEAAFRREETLALAELCNASGRVIACGGGVVTVEDNFDIIRQNAKVVWLRRPLEALATADRPLSAGPNALEALYARRASAYERMADVVVDNDGTLDETVDRVLTALGLGKEQTHG